MIDWPHTLLVMAASALLSIYITYRLIREMVWAAMKALEHGIVDHMPAESYKKYVELVYKCVRSEWTGEGRLTRNELMIIRVKADEHRAKMEKEYGYKRTREEALREIVMMQGEWQREYFEMCRLLESYREADDCEDVNILKKLAWGYTQLRATREGYAMSDDRVVYPKLPEPLRSVAIEAHDALHTLWTKAAWRSDYDKAEWKKLSAAIDALVKTANR